MTKQRKCECGKETFRDEIAAKLFLAEAARKDVERRPECRAYRCEHKGRWHVTSQR